MHRSRMLVQLYIQINPKGNRCLTRSLISTLSPPYPLNSKGIGNKTSPKERSTCLPIFHRLCDFMEKRLKNLLLPFYCSPQKFILERDSMVVRSIIDILQQSHISIDIVQIWSQKIQCLNWNLVPGHLIWICRIQWLYSLSSLDQRIRFGQS